MKIKILLSLCASILLGGCAFFHGDKTSYANHYDVVSDQGQYTMPLQKFGKSYWSIETTNAHGTQAIVDNLLSESISGLMALAVNDGRSDVMAWMDVKSEVYARIKAALPMSELGTCTAWELLAKPDVKALLSGYVVYDTARHESINVATMAAHAYNGVMVASHEVAKAEALGYKKLYDSSQKNLADAWVEFKDRCNNNALVLMPGLSSNQRSTAISARLMCVNLNKVSYKPELGSNKELLLDVLQWLQPLSPVFGWEQGVGEDSFVGLVSRTGNLMIPYDWTVNTPIMWAEYEKRQGGLAKVLDPKTINFGDAAHYVSFYMSDGDNVQWMITNFDNANYYRSELATKTRMTFGFPVMNLAMISPDQNAHLLATQQDSVSLAESLGGGYHYSDNFGELKDRKQCLELVSKRVATHMRQHRNNVLALVCDDVISDEAKEAYQSFISHNDQLLGVVVIQYTPYAGGRGETMWFKNGLGYDIPVVTVRYSLWNYGVGNNGELEGTPAYIASKYNQLAESSEPTFSATSVHAWSQFSHSDSADDLTAENNPGNLRGVEPAAMCMDRFSARIKVVNIEELLWQLRMHTFPDQTKALLKQYK